MRNKNLLKIIFDFVMLILLALMYDKSVLGMQFHEVGGLILFGLFALHLAYNHRWITQTAKRVFSKGYSAKQRIMYILNILLVLVFLTVGITGILISKVVVQHSDKNMAMSQLHYTAAALALVLIGVHVGLHWKFIISTLAKKIPLPVITQKAVSVLLITAIVGFGIYGTYTSKLRSWLSSPIGGTTAFHAPEEGGLGHDPTSIQPGNRQKGERMQRQGDGLGKRSGHDQQVPISPLNVLIVCVTFMSMVLLYAIITHLLWQVLTRRKRE